MVMLCSHSVTNLERETILEVSDLMTFVYQAVAYMPKPIHV